MLVLNCAARHYLAIDIWSLLGHGLKRDSLIEIAIHYHEKSSKYSNSQVTETFNRISNFRSEGAKALLIEKGNSNSATESVTEAIR